MKSWINAHWMGWNRSTDRVYPFMFSCPPQPPGTCCCRVLQVGQQRSRPATGHSEPTHGCISGELRAQPHGNSAMGYKHWISPHSDSPSWSVRSFWGSLPKSSAAWEHKQSCYRQYDQKHQTNIDLHGPRVRNVINTKRGCKYLRTEFLPTSMGWRYFLTDPRWPPSNI